MAKSDRIYLHISTSVYILFYLINVIYSTRVFFYNNTEHRCWLPFQTSGNSQVNWVHYQTFYSPGGDTCYYLSINVTSYDEAVARCQKLGSNINLFSDDDPDEHDFILDYIIPSCIWIHADTDCTIWMGLRWNSTCTWLDGTPYSWSNWPLDLDDQCLQPYTNRYCPFVDRKGIWDARTCARNTYHLCEWKVPVTGSVGKQEGSLAAGSAGHVALLVIFLIILILLILLLVFLLVGKFYVCPRITGLVNEARIGNSPDPEQSGEETVVTKSPSYFKTKVGSFGCKNKNKKKECEESDTSEDRYAHIEDQTLKIRGDEKTPFIENPTEDKDHKTETVPTYATPAKKKYMPKRNTPKDPHDEITVLETSIDT